MAGFDKQDTTNKVVAIIADKLQADPQTVTVQATLQDLGADSLDMAEIIIKIEEELRIEIDDEQAEKLNNVGNVVDYVHVLRAK